jgi:hypothetical protein
MTLSRSLAGCIWYNFLLVIQDEFLQGLLCMVLIRNTCDLIKFHVNIVAY